MKLLKRYLRSLWDSGLKALGTLFTKPSTPEPPPHERPSRRPLGALSKQLREDLSDYREATSRTNLAVRERGEGTKDSVPVDESAPRPVQGSSRRG